MFIIVGVIAVILGFVMPSVVGIIAEKRGHSMALWGVIAFACVLIGGWVFAMERTYWGMVFFAVGPVAAILLPNRNKVAGLTLQMPLPPKEYLTATSPHQNPPISPD